MAEPAALNAHDLAAETRRILALAWPVVLTGLNWTILHLTDVIVVGAVSTHEVAVLGASRALTFIAIVAGLAWLSGILAFVARADGAGDLPRTGAVMREGLVCGLMLGLAIGAVLLFFAEPLLLLLGTNPALTPEAAGVVRIMAIAYPAQFILLAASYFLEGVSRPQRVMVVNLAMLPVNAVLAWAWSGGHLGLPRWGAEGAAAATSLVSFLGTVAMVYAVWSLPRAEARAVKDTSRAAFRAALPGAWALAKFGLIPAIASGLELLGFSILIALSTQLGDVTAHAFQIVFSIHNVTFAVALGFGSAAGVRTGNAVGEGRADLALFRTTIAATWAVGATAIMAVAIAFAAFPLAQAFPGVPAIHLLAAALIPIWAPFILFDGLQVVFVYALRSLGDQVAAGINGIIAFFLVTGGVGWALVHAGWGPVALVYGSGFGMLTAALLQGGRFWAVSRRQKS